jgi:cytochrome c-type biogenesis protein
MDMHALISQWMDGVAHSLPVGYAFGAGMVSAVNPCGFAMLPVYLSLYVGAENEDFQQQSLIIRLLKAVWVAAVVTSGFALLFGIFGGIVAAGGKVLVRLMPWVSVGIGGLLVLLGGWLLAGRHLSFGFMLRLAGRLGDPRKITVRGFFVFGMAFGATSLSCTLPVFLMVVGSSAAAGDFAAGIVQFVSYILGMGAILLLLTVSMALIRETIVVGVLRSTLPYIQRVSAILIILAGIYILHYWLSSGLLFN